MDHSGYNNYGTTAKFMYACSTYVHTHVQMYVCMYIRMYGCMDGYMYVAHVCMYVHTYVLEVNDKSCYKKHFYQHINMQ